MAGLRLRWRSQSAPPARLEGKGISHSHPGLHTTAVCRCEVSANRLHGFGRFMLQNIGHARQAIVITCRPTANEARMEASGFTRLRNSRAGDVRWKPSGRGVVAPLPACAGDTRGVAVVGAYPG
jgi:hypothetical protein